MFIFVFESLYNLNTIIAFLFDMSSNKYIVIITIIHKLVKKPLNSLRD